VQTETHPQQYHEADEESWDLQFDDEDPEPASRQSIPFRPIGAES
jgi:hypothetical protein